MAEAIIELNELTKQYGDLTAVDRLTLTIHKGEVFGLLGPNGAGKSTTILMMLGLSEPTSGSSHVCGIDSTRSPLEVKKKVGYLPDDIGFYEDLTGIENLVYTASLNRIPKAEAVHRAEQLLQRVGLAHAAHKKAGTYSRGMRQRLGLADVLIKQPEVIVLDEPTLGIDPKGVRELLQLIRELSRDEGITVLLSSHQLHQVQQICDRVGLFVKGKLLAADKVAHLSQALFGTGEAGEERHTIYLQASPLSHTLKSELRQIEGILDWDTDEQQSDMHIIYATRDVRDELTAKIVEHGASLQHLSLKEYGLDDIYHRYFEEGGEADALEAKEG